MKVMCIINGSWQRRTRLGRLLGLDRWRDCDGPVYGDILEVIGGQWEDGIYYLHLKEWPKPSHDPGWDEIEFIPIETDEEEEKRMDVEVNKLFAEIENK